MTCSQVSAAVQAFVRRRLLRPDAEFVEEQSGDRDHQRWGREARGDHGRLDGDGVDGGEDRGDEGR